jgi:drug/metabolite transporter (DMT)-like permease
MFLLFLVSLVWAFSFGLIKGRLAGIDPTVVATLRLALAAAVFLPFYRPRGARWQLQLRLGAIGAIQFGVMYLFYLRSFNHLQAFEVALFTITTPFFVTLLDAAVEHRVVWRHALAALLAVAGAGVIVWQRIATRDLLIGIALVQLSNICFAAGQIAWRRTRAALPAEVSDASLFAIPYVGAFVASLGWSAFTSSWSELHLNGPQIATLVYLGVLASGLGFFWWNIGATRVNAGTLAAFNNAKIPLAVACSLLFFGEHVDLPRLLLGGTVMASGVWFAQRTP